MSLTAAPPIPIAKSGSRAVRRNSGETLHRVLLVLLISVISAFVGYLTFHGFSYYTLPIEQRPLSPLHSQLRSSGQLGFRLGLLSAGMFCILFLYPLRKRWLWLSTIGSTRRWLNFHVVFGIATPVVVTFHTSFKWHGLAGLAYWTMMAVALSGFVGRYVYAKIPRSLSAVQQGVAELEAQTAQLAEALRDQKIFRAEDLAPLLSIPAAAEIRSMNLVAALWKMISLDLRRPFLVSRLRRRALPGRLRLATLGGLLHSHVEQVERIVANVRRQSRLLSSIAFLDRMERLFHLWHIVHRPFSISFVVLALVHISVVFTVGF